MSGVIPHLSTAALQDVMLPVSPADGFDEISRGLDLKADVVIVGTGPGGAAAARILAEAGKRVILLEEGPARSRFRKNQANTARYHMQEGGTMVAQGSTFMSVAAGRGVGGSSLINSALCFQPKDEMFDRWVGLLGDERWAAAGLRPLYDEVAEMIGVSMTPTEIAGRNNQIIADGVAALGWEGGLAPRNTPGCKGCGVCNYGCPSDGKASTNHTFLPRAVAKGARIIADTRVVEVLVEGGRAVGVRGQTFNPDTGERGADVIVRAPRVILSAGAIGTPRLLWTSGLGDKLGPVGEGLHLHPGSAVLGLADEPVYMWRGATQGAYFTHPDLPGVLPHTFTAPPEVCLMATNMIGPRLRQGLAELPYLCGILMLVSDKGHGSVRATSDGRAKLTYNFDDGDVVRIKDAMVACAKVMKAGGARELLSPVYGVGRYTTVEALADAISPTTIKDFTLYSSHPMASCRMGRSAGDSVLKPDGEAHRLPGLTVADASVFPTALGVNPQLTTMVVATRIAQGLANA